MRIGFDVSSSVKAERGGIANYGWSLIAACARVAPEHDYRLFVRPHHWFRRAMLQDLLPGTRPRLLIDAFAGRTLARLDVLHGIGVRLPPRGCPRVVTLHDLNVLEFPELSTPDWRVKRTARIRQTLERAQLVISYSEQGATALREHTGFPRERIRVVPIGVDTAVLRRPAPDVLAEVLGRHGVRDRPYVLHVGAASPRKNQAGLLAAFARADLPREWVLLLGGPRAADAATLRAQARALGLPDERVLLPGWIAEPDLPVLLAGAAIYCCPSLHEGFGIPVLEAQACGAPVLSSNRGALPETVGECGVLFDPGDEAALPAALARLAGDAALRADLSRRGPLRVARQFTWEAVARATLAVHAEASRLRED
ncbi:MAG TPA: glycosyltransferase family 1 protein [Planctomycetota bacterium]|nr:glycosyltransferase family 1 protein [Planctomycetota bacterium]